MIAPIEQKMQYHRFRSVLNCFGECLKWLKCVHHMFPKRQILSHLHALLLLSPHGELSYFSSFPTPLSSQIQLTTQQ